MAEVKIVVNAQGDIYFECSDAVENPEKCMEKPIIIEAKLYRHPFYDIYAGHAFLQMLGHVEYIHNGREKPK